MRFMRWTYVVFSVCVLFLFIPTNVLAASPDQPIRYNADRTVAAITIDAATAPMVRELIEQVQRNGGTRDVTALVSLVGAVPELVIMGNDTRAVAKAVRVYQAIMANANKQRNLVVITASLRQLSHSDARNIGLNLMPNAVAYQVSRRYASGVQNLLSKDIINGRETHTESSGLRMDNSGVISAQSGNLLQFDDAMSRSKILVSSEVFTPNGMKGQISSIQRVPVFTMDKNGNVNTQYQDLETSITVTPTIVHYNEEKPEESNVRMEVAVKVAIVSGARKMQSISAPEYAVKTLNTTQLIRADGSNAIVGTFVSDTDIKTRSGVPFLSEIPLIKYLFSQSTTQTVREMAVLTLAVRVLPAEEGGSEEPQLQHSETLRDADREDASHAPSPSAPSESRDEAWRADEERQNRMHNEENRAGEGK